MCVDNEGVLSFPRSSIITGTSPSDCLVSYPGLLSGGGFLLLYSEAVSVFYSPNRPGKFRYGKQIIWLKNVFKFRIPLKPIHYDMVTGVKSIQCCRSCFFFFFLCFFLFFFCFFVSFVCFFCLFFFLFLCFFCFSFTFLEINRLTKCWGKKLTGFERETSREKHYLFNANTKYCFRNQLCQQQKNLQ